ncbi:MAG TPA: hypothetical protein DIT64_20900 [Verrucomicrobiales bacterium]|nr:hypothetical protein [Verrucomicrobiales bacterium]
MNADQIVWIDPERMSGTPCFTGTRVPISTLKAYLGEGDTMEMFLDDFPSVSREQALALLEMGEDKALAIVSDHALAA